MTNRRVKNNLKNMLFVRYNKLHLSSEEVRKEILDNPRLIVSTSTIPDTWLIEDVVSYLCAPDEVSKAKAYGCKRKTKEVVIRQVDKDLQKYWDSVSCVDGAAKTLP